MEGKPSWQILFLLWSLRFSCSTFSHSTSHYMIDYSHFVTCCQSQNHACVSCTPLQKPPPPRTTNSGQLCHCYWVLVPMVNWQLWPFTFPPWPAFLPLAIFLFITSLLLLIRLLRHKETSMPSLPLPSVGTSISTSPLPSYFIVSFIPQSQSLTAVTVDSSLKGVK